jgi:hypothetical protein
MHKSVALFTYEGRRDKFASTKRIFERMCKLGNWGDAVYFCADSTYQQAERFLISGTHLHYVTADVSHVLICSWDGFIVNPASWTADWLQYDVIGAPWPSSWHTDNRVGNLGFCLLSRRFLQVADSYKHQYADTLGDVYLCRTQRALFEFSANIRYAPPQVAAEFALEAPCDEHKALASVSFGFHGWLDGRNEAEYHKKYIDC